MTFLGYLQKLKKDLELTFGACFRHDFSIKFFRNLILHQWTKFQCHTFFLLKISNKMCYQVLSWTVDGVMNFKIYLGSTAKAMADREKKRCRPKYKNLNISRMKGAF